MPVDPVSSPSPDERPGNGSAPGKAKHCVNCGAALLPSDRFCPQCGHPSQVDADTAFTPIAASSTASTAGATRKRRRRRKKPWYRRLVIVIPLILLLVIGSVAGATLYRTLNAFDKVNSVSTPPPEVSGSALGGDEDLAIDTGPAQEALRQHQTEQANQQRGNDPATAPAVQPTDDSANAPSTTVAQGGPTEAAAGTEPVDSPSGVRTTEDATDSGTESTASEPAVSTAQSDVAFLAQSTPGASDQDGINILLMGVDARPGESIDVGVRADSLGVLHLDEQTGTCRILAVPRDSRVDMPGYGNTKINHALAVGGIPFEQLVVEEYLDITIDHYGLVDFAALTQVVDHLGGITVDNPEAFTVGNTNFAAGPIELDGENALIYSRYRGGADGDFGRVEKQQQVIKAIMDELTNANLLRLVPDMFSLLANHIRTDFGITDSIDLANTYRDTCTSSTLQTKTIPGDVQTLPDDMMEMELSFVVSDQADIEQYVDWLLTGDDPASSGSPGDTPATPAEDRRISRLRFGAVHSRNPAH